MSRYNNGFRKRSYPQHPMRDEYLFDRRRGPPNNYERWDFYPPPPRFPRPGYPLDDFSDMPMSPFLQRMMGPAPPDSMMMEPRRPIAAAKEEILMELGQSVVSSLKEGQKLSSNPLIREKLETLLQVEQMEEQTGPPPSFSGPSHGPYSRYDSFYERDFVPPIPHRPAPLGMGYCAPPKFPLAPMPPAIPDWYTFLRVSKDMDRNRIYASDSELARFFQTVKEKKPLLLFESVKIRLKNTFSFEISQTKNLERRNWLIMHYKKIVKSQTKADKHDANIAFVSQNANNQDNLSFESGKTDPLNTELYGEIKKKRKKDSPWKKQKKHMRDKRPPQSDNDRQITNYLKALLFELCGDKNEEHPVLVLRAISTNPTIIKCLMTECNTFLNQRFGSEMDPEVVSKKKSYLIDFATKHYNESLTTLQKLKRPVREVDRTNYDKYIDVLSGNVVDTSMFAFPTDYVREPSKSEDEFIVDFKYDFVRFAFEKFFYKVVENFCLTKNYRKRINFFMNNGFLAGLIWTVAQGKQRQLPPEALKYVTPMDTPCMQKSKKIDDKMLAKVNAKENYAVRTNYVEFAEGKGLSQEQEDIFKKSIALFDPQASVVKYQLVDYTPHNPLPRDYKLYVLNEIMKFVYLQVLDYVVKNPNLMTKTYTPMESDPVAKTE